MKTWGWTCSIDYTDHEGVARKGKGRTFHVGGKDLDLFPSGVLCGMIHRSQKTLYKWELHFEFPQSMYHVNDDKQKCRWYSRGQLEAIRALYSHYNQLKGENRTDIHKFIKALRKVFFTIDMPKETNVQSEKAAAGG